MTPKVLVLSGFGINGEREMAESFRLAGGQPTIMHINDLIVNKSTLNDYQILAFPGGFAYGDDLGAGQALANRLRNNLRAELLEFAQRDTLIIGICNGFQMMTHLGILPSLPGEMGERKVALRHNQTNRYHCQWTHVKGTGSKCIWTQGLEVLPLSIGHGEGNFYTKPEILNQIEANDQVALRYCQPDGAEAKGEYPYNPNGSLNDIAGICDDSGRIFGLMPHPDRFLTSYSQYDWTKQKELAKRAGKEWSDKSPAQQIYENGVNYFK